MPALMLRDLYFAVSERPDDALDSRPAARDLRPYLAGFGLLSVLALEAFSDPRPPAGVWGAVGELSLPPVLRAVLLAAAALLAVPPVGRAAIRAVSGPCRRVGDLLAATPAWLVILALVAAGWVLRGQMMNGDGPDTIASLQNGELINFKEPLDRLVTALVYRAGYALVAWDAGTAMALVSTLAGAVYWMAVVRLARSVPIPGSGAWVVWGLLGTVGAVELFFGHQENYSLLTAGTLWTLVLCLECVDPAARPLWPAALVFGVTVATHLSAVWLAGALVATWAMRAKAANGRWPRAREWLPAAGEAVRCGGLSVLPLAAVAAGMVLTGSGLAGFSASNFGGGDGKLFVPLFKVETPFERFTMFSGAHFAGFGNELLLVAPVGVVLAVTYWAGRKRSGARTDAGTWVLLWAVAGTVAYAFTFNPDMMVANPRLGVMNEWDLFASEAVPITLLGLWWLRTASDPGVERDAVVMAAVAAALVHAVPWVLLNAGLHP